MRPRMEATYLLCCQLFTDDETYWREMCTGGGTAIPLLERSHVNFDLIYFSVRTNVKKGKGPTFKGPRRHFSR